MHPDQVRPGTGLADPAVGDRRSDDGPRRGWSATRDLLVAAVAAPVRPRTAVVTVLGAAVVLAESVGLLARRACSGGSCGPTATAWAHRLDMDALGSVPRGLVTAVLASVAVLCLSAVWRSGRHGAGIWWAVLGLGCAVLAAAKQTSVHSLVETRLAAVLPTADVQLLFVVVSLVGLLTVVVSGRWVRRETRTVVTTWLALYAAASVGLAAATVVLARLGSLVGDLSTFVEETGEGLAAVGLLVVVTAEARAIARRRRTSRLPV